MRTLAKFDRNHIRCIYPEYGQAFHDAMEISGLTPAQIADSLGIAQENVLGYRRGFQRNKPNLTARIEALLAVKLPYHELTPSKAAKAPTPIVFPTLKMSPEQVKAEIAVHLDAIRDLLGLLPA